VIAICRWEGIEFLFGQFVRKVVADVAAPRSVEMFIFDIMLQTPVQEVFDKK